MGSVTLEEVNQGCGGTSTRRGFPDSDKAGSSTHKGPVLSHRLDYTAPEVLPKHHFYLSTVTLISSRRQVLTQSFPKFFSCISHQ